MFGFESRWLDSLLGIAFATGGLIWARPWWKAALIVAFGLGLTVWGYWRGPTSQERGRRRREQRLEEWNQRLLNQDGLSGRAKGAEGAEGAGRPVSRPEL